MQAICFRLQSKQRSVSSLVSGIPRAKIRDSQIALRISTIQPFTLSLARIVGSFSTGEWTASVHF